MYRKIDQKFFRPRQVTFQEQQRSEELLNEILADLNNPTMVYAHVDANQIYAHMLFAHSFYGYAGLVNLSQDAHFFTLYGVNLAYPNVKRAVIRGYYENLIKHDFHEYATNCKQYKRLLFSLTPEKVS